MDDLESEAASEFDTPRVHAPEIAVEGADWFNVDTPLSLRDLRGKLVILDFWSSCCVNCMHVQPALYAVQALYPEEVAVIGVHSPKFAAEQRPETVRAALARAGMEHPVVNDVNFELWRAYAVRAWPTLVLIDHEGYVLGQLSGEPDKERLITVVSEFVERWDTQGVLQPSRLSGTPERDTGGRFRFPGKLKPLPDAPRQWALADAGHHQLAVLDDDGAETARYGTGQPGFADGPPDAARFRAPQGLAADEAAIYVADTGNHAIRRVSRATGRVHTVAGTGARGGTVDEREPSLAADLASPWDLAVDTGVLYVANAGTHQVLRLDLQARELAPLAGNGGEELIDGPGTEAQLAQPSGLALEAATGRLYVADSEASAVRAIDPATGEVATLVGEGLFTFGHDNGPFSAATLQHPLGVTAESGEVLVADTYNNAVRVLDLAARRVRDLDAGEVCGAATGHALAEPAGVWADGARRVLVSDTGNHRLLAYDAGERTVSVWAA
mgnify:CR=1 FL=1